MHLTLPVSGCFGQLTGDERPMAKGFGELEGWIDDGAEQEAHVKELTPTASSMVRQPWGIPKGKNARADR